MQTLVARQEGKCGYADSAGAGTTAVVCPTEYLPKYGVDKNCCNSATCVTAVANSSDTNSSCQADVAWGRGGCVLRERIATPVTHTLPGLYTPRVNYSLGLHLRRRPSPGVV